MFSIIRCSLSYYTCRPHIIALSKYNISSTRSLSIREDHNKNFLDTIIERLSSNTGHNTSTIRSDFYKALTLDRSDALINLFPEGTCETIKSFYSNLELQPNKKFELLTLLAIELGIDRQAVTEHATLLSHLGTNNSQEMAWVRQEAKLRRVLVPLYSRLFQYLAISQGGLDFLLKLRCDIAEFQSGELNNIHISSTSKQELKQLDDTIKEVLLLWFTPEFLEFQPVTWDSSCSLLERVMHGEAVHPVQDWRDLKLRISQSRRCFILTHKRLSTYVPLCVLHCGLCMHIPDNIQSVLNGTCLIDINNSNKEQIPNESPKVAVFYSISNTQPGLRGVELGNLLIKQAVTHLQREIPSLTTFVTLSPIPGFRKWLETNPSLIFKPPTDSETEDRKFKFLKLCSHYLVNEKRRGFTLDPVANFHIRNGAILWRINWEANMNENGINQSYGLMANYLYQMENLSKNNQEYITTGSVQISEQIDRILKNY